MPSCLHLPYLTPFPPPDPRKIYVRDQLYQKENSRYVLANMQPSVTQAPAVIVTSKQNGARNAHPSCATRDDSDLVPPCKLNSSLCQSSAGVWYHKRQNSSRSPTKPIQIHRRSMGNLPMTKNQKINKTMEIREKDRQSVVYKRKQVCRPVLCCAIESS